MHCKRYHFLHAASLVLFVCTMLVLTVAACTQSTPEPLANQGWVSDYAKILSQPDKTRIAATLEAFEKETCHQVYLLVVPDIAGENIVDFSQRTARAWDIGQPGFGNGILLSIAMQEGSIRLETASAFDWFVEEGITKRILEEVMIPFFKQKKFVEGIEYGLDEIMQAARRKVVPDDHKPEVCRK